MKLHKTADTLDDLLHFVFTQLLKKKHFVTASRGHTSEIIGVILRLDNPRARLSLTESRGMPFSALGELCWYLSKSDKLDFIQYYLKQYEKESDDGLTLYGAYGPRIFNMRNQYNQIQNVINLLRKNAPTRRAVIQIFNAEDIADLHKEIPCTCTLQFFVRDNKLHMYSNMRSNDAYKGLPHDIFAFTMIQELIANTLSLELGHYNHAVGSLHLYDDDWENARKYLKEGWQSKNNVMPKMPKCDPWPSVEILLQLEEKIRKGLKYDTENISLDPYWLDLVNILRIFNSSKAKDIDQIKTIKRCINNPIYKTYINKKIESLE